MAIASSCCRDILLVFIFSNRRAAEPISGLTSLTSEPYGPGTKFRKDGEL
eukprot:m.28923 g.28923  ORF g.28923 m.28923 type:complete len:50 (+) comp14238_c0_seq2:209-358(+)